MRERSSLLLIVTVLVWLAPDFVVAQSPLRTPWGAPDLQGIWTGSTMTPLERRSEHAGKAFLTEEEAAALERRADESRFVEREPSDGDPGTYNQIWFDPGTRIVSDRRTALITAPPDGQVPYTSAMAERQRLQVAYRVNGQRDSWVDVDTGERCMSDGVPMFWLGYNPNHQIVQTPNHVVILHEMFRDRRIIPITDQPHTSVRQWNGDIRGHWDGDTLVVETTNYSVETRYSGASARLHLVERFTRVAPDTIQHEITLDDSDTWTEPWTVMLVLKSTEDPIFEYACHEGNYSMPGILGGARLDERVAEVR